VRAQARCAIHTGVESAWSSGKTVTINPTSETVSTPNTPSGPSSGEVGQSLTYSTGGSSSNLGHSIQYRFDWDDGSFSGWTSSTSASHSWSSANTYTVRAQARCAIHTGVESAWSSGKTVTIKQPPPTPTPTPTPTFVVLNMPAGINVDPAAFNLVYYDGVEVTLPTGTEPPELIAVYYYDPVALELLYYFPGWPSTLTKLEHCTVYIFIV